MARRGDAQAGAGVPAGFPAPRAVARGTAAAVLVVVVLLLLLRDGGPPQGTFTGMAAVEEWALHADGADGGEEVLCGDRAPCRLAALAAARDAGASCRITAVLWLAASDHPGLLVALADPRMNATTAVVRAAPDAAEENVSVLHHETTLAWTGGWWWRAFPERLHVAYPVPCDAWLTSVSVTLAGRTWWGGAWTLEQEATWSVHTDLGALPTRARS